jgi:hypothetical protein
VSSHFEWLHSVLGISFWNKFNFHILYLVGIREDNKTLGVGTNKFSVY